MTVPSPSAGLRPLRFPIGARVECRMGMASWLPGVVVAHYVTAAGAPGQRKLPYKVQLDGGDSCYAPIDRYDLIRAAENAEDVEDVEWNGRTQGLEIAASASICIDPSSSRLAIGMWLDHAVAGRLFAVDMAPHDAARSV